MPSLSHPRLSRGTWFPPPSPVPFLPSLPHPRCYLSHPGGRKSVLHPPVRFVRPSPRPGSWSLNMNPFVSSPFIQPARRGGAEPYLPLGFCSSPRSRSLRWASPTRFESPPGEARGLFKGGEGAPNSAKHPGSEVEYRVVMNTSGVLVLVLVICRQG